jgi:hypothetical protein
MAEIKKNTVSDTQVLRRNLLVTFVLMIVLIALYATIPGYNFAVKDVAIHNKELMDHIETRRLNANLPELTLQQKRLFKIGCYWYIDYMRESTPTNAVILLPPKSVIADTSEFNLVNNSEWMEYFLFPRLCISEDEKATKPELYSKITHVAIVNGWGYDKLKYQPSSKPSEAVLSIEEPKRDAASAHSAEPLKPQLLDDPSLKPKTNVKE